MSVWEVEYTDEFEAWWNSLDEEEQVSLAASVGLLEELGPQLPRPHCDTVNGSRHSNMKELRTQDKGRPLRTFFAFDPRRMAILLIGGKRPETSSSTSEWCRRRMTYTTPIWQS